MGKNLVREIKIFYYIYDNSRSVDDDNISNNNDLAYPAIFMRLSPLCVTYHCDPVHKLTQNRALFASDVLILPRLHRTVVKFNLRRCRINKRLHIHSRAIRFPSRKRAVFGLHLSRA